ncbi:hypothetical protein XENOCAPTIV_027741 [Xenoophorus captivus]|uniref:Uncharacterized protein n=1 Tax=Xenoophorus captivus TaxID=1517983 RepID=A0ABV0QNA5_9TELE
MGDSFIIAVDFGTAYSGYAFNITSNEGEIEPILKMWGKEHGLETPKTPTSILFDEDGEFMKFGYEAQAAYINMRGEDAKKHYFFENFKMALYGRRDESLYFLFQAGIVTEKTKDTLIIALEPEAASVWCKKLPSDGFITPNHSRESLDQSPGTQYIVVDCGGGTIDITVHEVLEGGALKELHKASGNDLGGQTVDRKFTQFLREIFSDGVWEEYEENYPSEVQRMLHDFTRLKQVDEDIQITCPFNLGQLAQKKKDIERFFECVKGAFWNEGSIKISKEKMRSFFKESLQGITRSLNEIFKKDFIIEFILLVGGYAGSQILRQHITDQFVDKCKILCPFRPQEAIVKGAVQFGKNPEVVASRKSAFTYGIETSESFDESRHKAEKKFMADGCQMCSDVFMKLVSEGDDVGWDDIREHTLYAIEAGQTAMSFTFFRTERRDVKYVDDWGVEEVASFEVDMPVVAGGRKRKVMLQIKFGSTEITATATDMASKSKQSIKIDFMTK